MKFSLLSALTFATLTGGSLAYDLEVAYDNERLFERAESAVQSSRDSRREVARENSRSQASRGLASDLSEEDLRWKREVDGVLREVDKE